MLSAKIGHNENRTKKEQARSALRPVPKPCNCGLERWGNTPDLTRQHLAVLPAPMHTCGANACVKLQPAKTNTYRYTTAGSACRKTNITTTFTSSFLRTRGRPNPWVGAIWPVVFVAKMPTSQIDASAASCTCPTVMLACPLDRAHPVDSFCAVRQAQCFCRQGLRIDWVC